MKSSFAARKSLHHEPPERRLPLVVAIAISLTFTGAISPAHALTPVGQNQASLTPQQREIEKQRQRLGSIEVEERRDAVTRLGALSHPEASRAAIVALSDSAVIVRATAVRAILSLGGGEAATLLSPLLKDRDEFVRREAAYALGVTQSPVGVPYLVVALETDKKPSVRGAAAVALGRIADSSAASALASAVSRRLRASGFFARITRRKVEEDEFVRRSAIIALGQLRSREGVPVLISAVADQRAPDDVRREAARSLGLIGDPSALPALRAVLDARDPYLAQIASDAIKQIQQPAVT